MDTVKKKRDEKKKRGETVAHGMVHFHVFGCHRVPTYPPSEEQ